jgi:hypothetical protein
MTAVTITGDRAANLGLCSVLGAFEQGGIFIVTLLLRHGTSVYSVSSERPAPTSPVGFEPPTQGSSDHSAPLSNHCSTQAASDFTQKNLLLFNIIISASKSFIKISKSKADFLKSVSLTGKIVLSKESIK